MKIKSGRVNLPGNQTIEQLSASVLESVGERVEKPGPAMLELPEKILQFGTGALLRGLPDFFVDEANKRGIFNGRVVVVKSTAIGTADAFDQQDGLYTICIRGIDKGVELERNCLNASISRVISARGNWPAVLAAATDPGIQIVISNTTEVGLQYHSESVHGRVPDSFPGKLLACLHARFEAFNGSPDAGLVILPTELISNNGKLLSEILLRLAVENNLSEAFRHWLMHSNQFCNTLVDCIVPGFPDQAFREEISPVLGYRDELLIVSEVYRLWAIEGGPELLEKLAFAGLNNGIVIAPDITKYKELKLRLLNCTHTLSCGLAWLAGFRTVKEAMAHPAMETYLRTCMLDEISPAIPFAIPEAERTDFARKVLDRFANPALAHQWISITMQYSSKMRSRCIPVLVQYVQVFQEVPARIALGFAAYLVFSRASKSSGDKYFGEWQGIEYPIVDDQAGYFYELWKSASLENFVTTVLQNNALWGIDLTNIPGFEIQVQQYAQALLVDPMTIIPGP